LCVYYVHFNVYSTHISVCVSVSVFCISTCVTIFVLMCIQVNMVHAYTNTGSRFICNNYAQLFLQLLMNWRLFLLMTMLVWSKFIISHLKF